MQNKDIIFPLGENSIFYLRFWVITLLSSSRHLQKVEPTGNDANLEDGKGVQVPCLLKITGKKQMLEIREKYL